MLLKSQETTYLQRYCRRLRYWLHLLYFQFSWSFKHDDLKKAVLSLLVDDELQSDEYVIRLVQLIKEQFENEHEMFDWTKDIFQKVKLPPEF